MAASKSPKSHQKLFLVSLLLISLPFMFFVFSLRPKPNSQGLESSSPSVFTHHTWFDLVPKKMGSQRIKVGLVNVDGSLKHAYDLLGMVETVTVDFEPVSKKLKWEDFFPEWIDEKAQSWSPMCPEIPFPRFQDYKDLDIIVVRVPCGEGSEKKGIRDVFRLQVNLVAANLAVENGWEEPGSKQTVHVVFMGSCGPMQEIFRCDDLVSHVGDYWVYKPELKRLKQKVLMPVGSCQIAPPYAEKGKEVWRDFMSQSRLRGFNHKAFRQRFAYATILHSSDAYVCGAITLAQSIKQTNSTIDLVLLHNSSITPSSLRGLRAAGWKTRLIQPIRSPFAKKGTYNEWNYSKLRVWQLLDYDKVVFIDSDLIVLKKIEELFVYPQLSASPNDKVLFNSGVMVVEPSACMFENLMSKSFKLVSYNGGDQGFLNEAFTWWHRLPKKLNYLKIFSSEKIRNGGLPRDVYTLHYLGWKPWMCYRDYDCNWDMEARHIFASDLAHRRWWEVYDAMPKKLQRYCALTEKSETRIRKWRRIAMSASLPDGHWKIKVKDPRRRRFDE